MWGELSSEWGELSSECGASCLGASFLSGELSWGELSLGRVVRNPRNDPVPNSPIRVVFRLWASRQRWRTLNLSLPEFYKLLLILTMILFLLELLQLTIVGYMYV